MDDGEPVADDDPKILELLHSQLSLAGYVVYTCSSGKIALAKFQEVGGFDLLVTDLVMGGEFSGKTLAKTLRKLKPNLPVIFLLMMSLRNSFQSVIKHTRIRLIWIA